MTRSRRIILIILLVILVIVAAVGVRFVYRRIGPGNTWSDYESVYNAGPDDVVIFRNGIAIDGQGAARDGRYYISQELAADYGSRFYYSDEGLLLYTTATETIEIKPSSDTYMMEGESRSVGYEIFFVEEETAYICTDFISLFENIEAAGYPADEEEGLCSRLYISVGTVRTAEVKGNVAVRELGGVKSPILIKTEDGERVKIIDNVDEWTRVQTESGFVGYVQTKYLSDDTEYEIKSSLDMPEYTSVHIDDKVCLVWQQMFSADGNAMLGEYLSDAYGINVISPTWFSLTDGEGGMESFADADYVQTAHERGMQVWALVDDFDAGIDTGTLLAETAARKNIISQLMAAAEIYGFDGINVDFEYVTEDGASHYLQFLRELSAACRDARLVFSIDDYPLSGGRSWYDLEEQGIIADYVIIMSYDEHYRGGASGSTASIDFSEAGITAALESVPADKLINGIPFYTRVWQETPEEYADPDALLYNDGASVYDGRYARDSVAAGMDEAAQLLYEHGADIIWLDDLGQYYGQYEEDGSTYRIWLEDARSLDLKMGKIAQYDIAGAAFWKLGMESSDVWDIIEGYLG